MENPYADLMLENKKRESGNPYADLVPATAQDRAQATASGVNRGALVGIPGMPVDTVLNVWDLAKAGAGTVGGWMGMKPENLPNLTDRKSVPGSSEWIADAWRSIGVGVDPNRPDDTASRILHAGGNATAQALIGGGPRAAKPAVAPPIPKNLEPGIFRRALESQPVQFGKDAGMAFTSGAAGQGVADATDNPALAILASFGPQAATQLTPMITRGLARGGEEGGRTMRGRLEDLRAAGIDSPSAGLAAGNRRLTWLDSMLSKLPGSSGVYAETATKGQEGMRGRVGEIRDNLSPDSSPLAAGQAMQDAILGPGGYREKFNRIYQAKDNRASAYIAQAEQYMRALGFTGFPIPNTLRAASTITSPIAGADNVSALLQTPRMPAITDALRADAAPRPPQQIPSTIIGPNGQPAGYTTIPGTQGGLPYEAIAGLSTKIGKEAASRAIVGTPEQGDFKQLYKGLAQDKEGAAAASLDPRAVPALQDANSFYSSGRKQIDKIAPFVGNEGNPVAPETTFQRIETAATRTPSVAQSVLGSVRGNVRDAQAAAIVDRLGRANPGAQDAEGSRFSSDTFLTRYMTIPEHGKTALFKPEVRRNLDQVARAADMVKSGAKVMANPSGSAVAGANMATLGTATSALGAGVVAGAPWAGLSGAAAVGTWVAGNYVTAKMLTNPIVVNWLAQATTMTPQRVQQSLGRLGANATQIKDGETRQDVEDFIRRLKDESPQ